MMKRFFLFFLLIPLLIIISCSNNDIIEEEKFIEVYTDLIIAQDTSAVDSIGAGNIQKQVFSRHNISEKKYIKTLEYYNEDPARWTQFFTKAIEHAERLKSEAAANP